MVKDVLVANPQSAKSEEVMTELDNRINPLPEYMLDEIEEGRYILGEKEIMEAAKSQYRHQQGIYINMLKAYYKNDAENIAYSDSLINLLNTINTPDAKYELVLEYLYRKEYNLASSVLNDIPGEFELSNMQQDVHQEYLSIYPIIEDMHMNGISVFGLDSTQYSTLDSLSVDIQSLPGAYARNILLFSNMGNYEEPYILPDTSLKNLVYFEEKTEYSNISAPKFKLYPNPSSEYVAVEYNLENEGCDGYITFTNNHGQEMQKIHVSAQKHSLIISTRDYPGGTYFVSLSCNEQHLETKKLIILH